MKIGKDFMEKTKHRHLEQSDQSLGKPQPSLELEYDSAAQLINLPLPQDLQIDSLDISTAIQQRRSIRKYTGGHLSIAELSHLLWCTQGVQKALPSHSLRTVPSAGARHALETWLVINNVSGVQPGLYRFVASKHQLVAVPYRMSWRYGERAYRYLHLDAGHVCQNLYLAAESIDAGVCAIASYDDDQLNTFLGLDGESAFAIYLATVGLPAQSGRSIIANYQKRNVSFRNHQPLSSGNQNCLCSKLYPYCKSIT
ncbi:MAG: nitroreductase [Anaerospora sp.]|nr:nitroreductase [Anaerospora sp.]